MNRIAPTGALMPMIHHFGPFELDENCFELREEGVQLPIARKVFDLNHFLLREHKRVVTTNELLDALWKGRAVIPGVVSQAVASARPVLGDDAAHPKTTATLRGRGTW